MHQITFLKHFKHIRYYILFSLVLSTIILYDWLNPITNIRYIYIVYIILGVISIITIYLHLEYYFANRGVILYIKNKQGELIYYKNGHEEILIPSIIKRIEIHQSRLYKKNGGMFPTDNYRFYKIVLKDGRKIIITSLLCSNLNYVIEGKMKVKERTIASIHINI